MNLTDAQIIQQYRKCGIPLPKNLRPPADKPAVPKSRYRSKLEEAYAAELDLQIRCGLVKFWGYESIRIMIADGLTYKPDFLVQMADGTIQVRETKGFEREGDRKSFLMASVMLPCFLFRMIGRRDGEWYVRREVQGGVDLL